MTAVPVSPHAWAQSLFHFNWMPQALISAQPGSSNTDKPNKTGLQDYITTPFGRRRLAIADNRMKKKDHHVWFPRDATERIGIILTLPQAEQRHIFILLGLALRSHHSRRLIRTQDLAQLKNSIGAQYYRFLRQRTPLLHPPAKDSEARFDKDSLADSGRRFMLKALSLPHNLTMRLHPQPSVQHHNDTQAEQAAILFIHRTLKQGGARCPWLSA